MIDVKAEIARAEELLAKLPGVARYQLAGSASYLPEEAADVDFLVQLTPFKMLNDISDTLNNDAVEYVQDFMLGWTLCGEYDTNNSPCQWTAARNGNLNFMLSFDGEFYDRYVLANEVCKALRLKSKSERIAVCAIIRDDRTAEEARSMFFCDEAGDTLI